MMVRTEEDGKGWKGKERVGVGGKLVLGVKRWKVKEEEEKVAREGAMSIIVQLFINAFIFKLIY